MIANTAEQRHHEPATGYMPSPRITRLRDDAMNSGAARNTGWLRDYWYMSGWNGAGPSSLPMRNGTGLATVIEHMPVKIEPGDLLAGEHGNDHGMVNFRAAPPPDLARHIQNSALTDAQQRDLMGWLTPWPFAWQSNAPVAPKPPELELAEAHGVVTVWGTDLNHSIRAYDKVLRLGFAGLRGEVIDALHTLRPTDPDAATRRANLLAWLCVCDAAMSLGERHAARAREMAGDCVDPDQRAEWLAMAEVCERVPALPARTLREAVQSLWFAHMITVWEDGVNANGIGRIDQILWPYYQNDMASGRLTGDEAAEWLAALWVKLYQSYDVQQMMIGGQTPDGRDATNELSYLVLDVTEGLGFVRCLSARLHRGSPRRFVSRCVDLVARGGGIPFFFNDEALVPALAGKGVPIEDARGYAAIGCIEITLPGQASPHAVSHWINLAKCLELALNDGRDMLDGAQVGPRTGTLEDFDSMADVLAALTAQLEHFAQWCVYGSNAAESAHRSQYRLPYLSLLTDDCVARGLDIIEGGARHNYHSSAAMAIPNAADSLAALQLAVFDEDLVSRRDLLHALRSNFVGQENLRLMLRNRVPKYGNDESTPDSYAASLAQQYCDLMAQFKTVSGGTFFTHLFTFTLMLPFGRQTAASADGRRAGEPLAYSVSPVQGQDTHGFTAVLRSLSRIPHHLVAASSSAILEVDPVLLKSEGRDALVDLITTAVDLGVGQMQFNVVSAETLRAAQAEPDRYRNLCVRVSGFSQQFCLLDKEMQDHIIARTKHRC